MEDAPTELRTFDPYDILGVRNPSFCAGCDGLRMTSDAFPKVGPMEPMEPPQKLIWKSEKDDFPIGEW